MFISGFPTTNSVPHIHLVLKIMWENKTRLIVTNHQAPHSWGFLFVGGWVDSWRLGICSRLIENKNIIK